MERELRSKLPVVCSSKRGIPAVAYAVSFRESRPEEAFTRTLRTAGTNSEIRNNHAVVAGKSDQRASASAADGLIDAAVVDRDIRHSLEMSGRDTDVVEAGAAD